VENIFQIRQKRQKHFPPKVFSGKVFDGRDFFQILEYKKFLILKKNIFLDFLFSKKQ
jgi:hypothetical protein